MRGDGLLTLSAPYFCLMVTTGAHITGHLRRQDGAGSLSRELTPSQGGEDEGEEGTRWEDGAGSLSGGLRLSQGEREKERRVRDWRESNHVLLWRALGKVDMGDN